MGELPSSTFIVFTVLSLYLFFNPLFCNCQQQYLNNSQLDCANNPSTPKGYLCNGLSKSCRSFLTFRSQQSYETPSRIAYLLASEATLIASANNISVADDIPHNNSVIVPIQCSCSGNVYQHNTPYTVKETNTYHVITKDIYQGLITCQALMGQNYYASTEIPVGAELTVPVLCACPSENQVANGVTSLLVYNPISGETVASIGKRFGVDEQNILEANMLSSKSEIYPFTPLLIPLKGNSCTDDPGSFFCECPNGSSAGGGLEELHCKPQRKPFPAKLVTILGVGIGVGLLFLFLLGCKAYQFIKGKRQKIRKRRLFRQNGGFLLQEKLSSTGGGENAKIFSAEELQIATDNYSKSRFLGQGGCGIVYKGMLPDGSIVAVKKARAVDRTQIEQFINEVSVLSQINHRNIVKLMGFCLETKTPLLVYEFISNGTLSHHIQGTNLQSSLSWDSRLRIACEVSGAVAYMHSAASIPIFHRDIKSSNILLDDKYSAKVSDFGISRVIPEDKTHLTTDIQGTFGYIDPEYFQSSQFTEKSDVYSFGVVLVELLTGRRPFTFSTNEGQNLVAEFISLTKENQLIEIVDRRVAKEARREDIFALSNIAIRCLRLNGKKRPTMKEVSMELEALRKEQRSLQVNQNSTVRPDDIKYTTSTAMQENTKETISLSLQMESTSI